MVMQGSLRSAFQSSQSTWAAVGLGPDQVPVFPGGPGPVALGVLVLEVLAQHRDDLRRDGTGRFRPPLGLVNF